MTDTNVDMVDTVAGGNRGLDALRTDKPPAWDGKKTTYTAWWYLMYPATSRDSPRLARVPRSDALLDSSPPFGHPPPTLWAP